MAKKAAKKTARRGSKKSSTHKGTGAEKAPARRARKKVAKKTTARKRGTAGPSRGASAQAVPRSRAVLSLARELATKIRALNEKWIAQGMPKRCALPTTVAGWRARLKLLPGYDPFATKKTAKMGLWFDVRRAVQAIGFFHEYLVHIKGEWANTPIWLEDWQQAWLGNLLGWKRADGTRRFRRYLLYIPRKNAKTTLSAGLQLELMVNDGEEGAELFCAAAEKPQAALLHDLSKEMIARSPALAARLQIFQYHITHPASASYFRVLSADANTKHGFNPHSAIIDEVHAQRNDELYEVLKTGMASRAQPLMGGITTADFERPSLCNRMHDHACAVRDGRIDDAEFLPAVWEASLADDITDPKTWAKANPNLGISVKTDYLESEAARAEQQPAYRNTFMRLHLNIRTQQAEKWIDLNAWARGGPATDAAQAAMRAEPVGAGRSADAKVRLGIDLASTDDFAAMLALWPLPDGQGGELIRMRTWFWMPMAMARTREAEGVPVMAWANAGWLTLTEGDRIDYEQIERTIATVGERCGCLTPAFDPFNAEYMTQRLAKRGFEPVHYQQAPAKLNGPTRHLEKIVAESRIRHEGCPVLNWMMGNTTLHRDTMDNCRPSKKLSAEKIDGVICAVMALGMHITDQGGGDGPSVYEERGLFVV